MIFRPALIEKILAGEKTQTRRPGGRANCQYRAGRTYAVQPGRGQRQVARLRVLEVRREKLGDISQEDAGAEGFPGRETFLRYWQRIYGEVDHDQLIWVLRFELVPA